MAALVATISSAVAWAENPPLLETARYQNAEAVELLLASGADPDTRQNDGATALHWAAYQEDADMLAALVQAGANVNITNRLGASPLYLAAKNGNAELIERLLNAGADPNLALKIGETPFMTASRAGTVEGVRQMIAAGADVNAYEKSREQTALMWAVTQGHVDVVRVLVNAGANLEARSKVRSRLMYAESSNGAAFDQGVVEQLGGFSPLLFAAAQGNVEIGQLLISVGVNINGTAANGASPLVVATHSGHPDFARLLLEAGADPDAIGAGYNALHAAVLRGDLETVEELLVNGADPDVRLKRATPVQRASEDWALKSPLISATPYWLAAYYREAKIMRVLEQGGANTLLTNEEVFREKGRTRADRLNPPVPKAVSGFASALQAAILGDSTRSRFYTQENPDPVGEERLALEAVIAAAEHGVNLNHSDFTESTAIHYAAARNLPTLVRELAERGADINAMNGRGQTPLDIALASEKSTDFFDFDARPKPGPKPSEVLIEFGALMSDINGAP
ncbi:ankyrin repeat domain-containing protein [Gammaproteobacteria bacterium]|jgi:ankyrin repeat protein|nr:ankyrin repeat domain-containing protein [Gammaproteobacteria bacterium]